MRTTLLNICLSFLFFSLFIQQAQADSNGNISLTLPEQVISQAITAMLPLDIDAHSKNIQGDITIINISELALTDKHLACRLHLAGNNLALVTEIAGHEIRLKVGAVQVEFKTNAALRFDQAEQKLYIKPEVKDISTEGDGKNGDIGQALIALLNGKEFPVSVQRLDPLIARTGAKTLTIKMDIADIQAKQDSLQLQLSPTVTSQAN